VSTKIPLLVLNSLSSAHQAQIAEVYDVTYAFDPAARAAAIAERGKAFRAVLTIGVIGIAPEEIAAMPAVELICCLGAGYECVPLEVTRARGIVTANGAGTNDDCVADHAFGLLIGIVREFRKLDRLCREGVWREAIPQPAERVGQEARHPGPGHHRPEDRQARSGVRHGDRLSQQEAARRRDAPLLRRPEVARRLGRLPHARRAGRARRPGTWSTPKCSMRSGRRATS
jgi:hypothetical protein